MYRCAVVCIGAADSVMNQLIIPFITVCDQKGNVMKAELVS